MFNPAQRKVLVLSALGGAIEFYDFIVFIFFAKIISQLFFPAQDQIASLMAVFAVFAVGYFARPLGGIVFGHLGDRYGRKKTFVNTVFFMAGSTFLIALLPTYQNVGLLAPILLVVLRVIQGFSLGGEIPGAIVFASETAPDNHRGLACGMIFFGVNTGLLVGSLLSSLLLNHLVTSQILDWGWRVPFIIGGILGIISFYLRKTLSETRLFLDLQQSKSHHELPLKKVLLHCPTPVLQGICVSSLQAVIVNVLYLYMPTYLSTYFSYHLPTLLNLNTVNIFTFSFVILVASYLSDHLGRKIVMVFGIIYFIALIYPMFSLFKLQHFPLVIVVTIISGLFASCISATFAPMLTELFPTEVRYSGVAFTYNIAFAFIGGLTPLLITEFIHLTNNVLAPCFWVMLIAVVAGIALISIPETFRKSL